MKSDEDFHKQTTLPDLHAGQTRYPLPQKIGPYKIESLLNKGGMSLLYLGIDPHSAEPIAVKILLPKYLKNKEIVSRFLKEAQIIGMTSHPNIVRLYGSGNWEKGLYIAMEFIRGISLRQFILKKSLSRKRALEIILQVAYALCHLHTHGVIHRDLKPENILITESGDIKVVDFGIAQLHGEEERITQRKKWMGTPIYMSPEQKENPLHISFASDIYSLGIIAYELILGRLSHGVIHLDLLPAGLRAILEKALKIDPKERYSDIVSFISDISHYLKAFSEVEEEGGAEKILQTLQKTFPFPPKAPSWPQVEIGIAALEGTSIYLEFFALSENRYGVLLAQPLQTGIASLIQIAALRGAVRMAIQFQKASLPEWMHHLNWALAGEPIALSALLLNPEKDQLSYLSCQSSPLGHIAEGSAQIRTIATSNPALGQDKTVTFLETSDNWNVGDTLILGGGDGLAKLNPADFMLLTPQTQAEKTLLLSPNSKAIVTLRRLF